MEYRVYSHADYNIVGRLRRKAAESFDSYLQELTDKHLLSFDKYGDLVTWNKCPNSHIVVLLFRDEENPTKHRFIAVNEKSSTIEKDFEVDHWCDIIHVRKGTYVLCCDKKTGKVDATNIHSFIKHEGKITNTSNIEIAKNFDQVLFAPVHNRFIVFFVRCGEFVQIYVRDTENEFKLAYELNEIRTVERFLYPLTRTHNGCCVSLIRPSMKSLTDDLPYIEYGAIAVKIFDKEDLVFA